MQYVSAYSGWIMIASGLLTSTMVYAAVAPGPALQSMFGERLSGPLAEIVVRNWAALITMVGIALIYGGLEPVHMVPILIFAGASKIVFIALVVAQGWRYLSRSVGFVIGIDAVFVALYALIITSLSGATI